MHRYLPAGVSGVSPKQLYSPLHEFIRTHTEPNTEAIYTDVWLGYDGIAHHDTRHETVNHSADEWV
ncbi:MAG: hypothetical protein V3S82_07025, partial [Dehalococcoidia bacterium]